MAEKNEIAFIDQAISDRDVFLAGLRPEVEAIILTSVPSAADQIEYALKARAGLEAIHLISHGRPGEVCFSSGTLSIATLADHHAALAAIGTALGRDGDLLLWSCNTGAGELGAAFVDALADATGAHVHASRDVIGAAAKGGSWEIDTDTGKKFAAAPLNMWGIANYEGVMATFTATTGTDSLTGTSANDTFNFAAGTAQPTDAVDGAGGTDTITLTTTGDGVSIDWSVVSISNVENLTTVDATVGSYDQTVAISATQWASFSSIDMNDGTDVLNVVANGDISGDATNPTITDVETSNLVGTPGNDTITLTGSQLDAILFGSGATINLGAGTGDTINLTSTSGDLNTLGATNTSIQGVEVISAATAGAAVTINLSGQTEAFTITGSASGDTITGGTGADTINAGAGNDTINIATAQFVSGESIDGGTNTDSIVLTSNGTTVDFSVGTIQNVETLTGSGSGDTVTLTAAQFAGLGTINLGGGSDTLNVAVSGSSDISTAGTPSVTNVENGNLTGSAGNDSITLTGAQLDSIIIGSGIINLGGGTTDAINLTSTSADLNTLGATNASIQGVEVISAAAAGGGVTIALSGQTEAFTITGSNSGDTLTAGSGNDTISGGGGSDVANGGGGTDTAVYSGAWVNYTVSGSGTLTVVDTRGGSPDGTDTVSNVENFQFSNGTFTAAQIINDAPIGVNDSNTGDAAIEAGGVANSSGGDPSASGNVLGNDNDADIALGDILTITGIRSGTEAGGGTFQTLSGATAVQGTYGTLLINPDGTYTYTLDNSDPETQALGAGQAVSEVFSYRVVDAHGFTDVAQITISVTGANDAPVLAGDLSATVAEDGSYTLTANDLGFSDPDDGAADVTFTVSNLVAGTIKVDGNPATSFTGEQLATGHVSFVHDGSETTAASFAVTVEDGNEDSSTPLPSTFNLTVTAVNEAPVLTGDLSAEVQEGGTYVLTADDLGFSDPDDAAADVTFTVSNLVAGTIKVDGNPATSFTGEQLATGHVSFAHDGSETTAASFAVTVEDGNEDGSAPAPDTFNLTVTPVNDAPVLAGDLSATVVEGGSYVLTADDLGFSDPDDAAADVTFTVSNLVAGTIKVDGNPATSFTGAQLATGHVSFVHDGSETTAASFAVTVEDGNEDGSTPVLSTFNLAVTPVDDPIGGGSVSFELDEEALPFGSNPANPADLLVSTLEFTAGSADLTSFAFSLDLNGLIGNTDTDATQELFWVRVDDTHIEARFDSPAGAPAISLTLTLPEGGIAAGTTGVVTVTAELNENLEHTIADNIETIFNAGGVNVVATDTNGTSVEGTVNLSVKDDMPLPTGAHAVITVHEDALGHSGPELPPDLTTGDLDTNGDGTPDIASDGDTATFTTAMLQSVVSPGADLFDDEEVAFRLRLDRAGNNVKDTDGHDVTSGGDVLQYQYVDASTYSLFGLSAPPPSGAILFAFTDSQANGGAFDPLHDSIVFTLTNNSLTNADESDDGTFTFDLKGSIDHPAGSDSVFIDLTPVFAASDFDDDHPPLPANTIQVEVGDDRPRAVADATTTVENNAVTYNVLSNSDGTSDLSGADGGAFLFDASPAPGQGSLTFLPNGEISFTPATNFAGIAVITYIIQDADGDQSTSTLTVTVTDTNNQAPTITSAATFTVAENTTAVGVVAATDADTTGEPLTFTISGGSDQALFAIDANSGALSFLAAPDYEAGQTSFTVEISASDGLNSTPQTITVNLTDQNDSAPAITSPASFSVAENATAVGTVTASDADSVGGPLTFTISGGSDQALFAIDANSGALSFLAAPDYEAGQTSFTVEISASDGLNSTPQTITVNLTDQNDSAPAITSPASFSVAENATAVGTVTASDADSVGGPLTFTISGGSDQALFAIDANSGALSFLAAPDYEAGQTSFTVEISASDGLNSTPQTITVNLTDQNDSAPAITSPASFSVAENATAVGTVTASDADSVGGPLTFTISGGSDQALFAIDANSGALSFLAAPDYEAGQTSFTVEISASDGLNSTPQTITVNLTDQNDSAPAITSPASFSVAENATAVGTVTASDADSVGGPLTFTISGGSDQALFAIDANSGALSFLAAPDYEAGQTSFTVEISASDGLNSTPQTITVNLTDQNDSAPAITSPASFSVAENATAVGTVTASDADSVGGPLTFTISGGSDQALFAIDANSGALSFLAAPDYEAGQTSFTVEISASDGLNSTPQTITVNLTDQNDSAPAITSPASFSVAENATAVGTVTASDADSVGGPLTFTISGGSDQALFAIDANSGALSFLAAPDYEAGQTSFTVEISASDGLNSTPQTITVNLTDQNDSAPAITSPASFSVAENATAVGTVTASDADSVGGPLTFTISGGSDQALFAIDANSGALSFLAAPDYEAGQTSFTVEISASDGLNSTPQTITVNLTDQNDSAPAITSPASFSVAENATAVGTVTASDADSVGGPLTFTISGGSDQALFAIDANSGALSFLAAPDYEAGQTSFTVEISASDGLNSTPQTITVNLTDQNDSAPAITSPASFSVAENATAVGTVTASDADSVGGPLTFTISGGSDQALFAIDANSGALSFLAAPDYEAGQTSFTVEISASDGLNSTPQTITVNLTDQNDSAPAITSPASFSVAENATAVGTVTASDADSVGGPLTFTISGGSDQALFAIDANSGALSFLAAPDYEAGQTSFTVEISASDGLNSTPQTITVNLTDQNDSAPAITSPASFSVAENATAVGTVTASDADSVGGPLTFTISGGSDQALFAIDANSGALSFLAAPDYEAGQTSFTVEISASDGLNSTPQTITVNLTDQNDSAPAITSPASFSVAENATAVGTVTASDADSVGGPLTFTISGGADADLFNIDAATGEVSFITAPDYEAPADAGGNNVYDVVVHANDGASDTTQAVAISVTDVEEFVGTDGDDTLTGTNGDDTLSGLAGNDTLFGLGGNDTLDGGTGADLMRGDGGDDTYIVDNAGDTIVEAAAGGADTVQSSVSYTLAAQVETLTLTGSGKIDGTGNSLDNTLIGNSGNNSLDGEAGADAMTGGLGDDIFYVDNAGDTTNEAVGGGSDTVYASVDYTLGAGAEIEYLRANAGAIGLALTGNELANYLIGGSGSDTLGGAAGNDRLDGRAGADAMTGGLGDDIFYVDNAGDTTNEAVGGGSDTVYASVNYTLGAGAEIEVLRANAGAVGLALTGNELANYLIGGSGIDTLSGAAGNDRLDGRAGADAMTGGLGDDSFYVDNAGDTTNEAVGGGSDTVYASVDYTLGAGAEIEYLRANAGAIGLALTGNELANYLIGGSGSDTLGGAAGNDRLDGRAGADAMTGGLGDDIFYVDNAGDTTNEAVGGGSDTVYASVDYTLGAGAEIEYLRANAGAIGLALTGNELANYLIGGSGSDTLGGAAGNDRLDGRAGADAMTGGLGDDIFYVDNAGDTTNEAVGGGSDTVYASVNYTLGAGAEIEVLRANAGAVGLALTGNELANYLIGGSGIDTLSGAAGNDRLDGRAGADAMTGGLGDDSFYVDNAGDTTNEAVGGGSDTVYASVDYTLGAGAEIEYLRANAGAIGLALTGNELANYLIGGSGSDTLGGAAGNDRLDGRAGADAMTGGLGDDIFYVDNAGDTTNEAVGGGSDTVYASVDYTLGAGAEIEYLRANAGAIGLALTGNELANYLIGGSGSDTLGGAAGNDRLNGGAGDDVFVFKDGDGSDTVVDFQDGADKFDLTAVADVHALSDIDVIDQGATLMIDYGTGSFVIANVGNPAAIDAGDFLFA